MTAGDRWIGRLHPVSVLLSRDGIRNFSRYRRAYSNSLAVTLARVGAKKYPFDGHCRNGRTVRLTKHRVAQLYGSDRIEPHPEDDSVRVRVGDRWWTLRGGWTRGDVHGVYVEDVYGALPVQGKTVVDVGASIGDSPVYFAGKGATKVVAIEPWPATFAGLTENIAANHLEGVILPVNAAVGPDRGTLKLDDRFESRQHAQTRSFETGTAVPTIPLADLVDRFDVREGVLKLDCEGAEYDALLGTARETLRRFTHIQVEYHYGYLNLDHALRQAGFQVRHSRPHRTVNPVLQRPTLWMGNLYARREP